MKQTIHLLRDSWYTTPGRVYVHMVTTMPNGWGVLQVTQWARGVNVEVASIHTTEAEALEAMARLLDPTPDDDTPIFAALPGMPDVVTDEEAPHA